MDDKTKLLKDSGLGYLVELAKEIQLQYKEDRNYATDKPVYCVYRKERYAKPEDRSVPTIISNESELRYRLIDEDMDWCESEDKIMEFLIETYGHKEYDVEKAMEYEKAKGNLEIIETQMYHYFETCFLTEKAAKRWIEVNKHHGDYFVYVHSLSLWSKGINDLEKVYNLLFSLDIKDDT
jgi:hypothetical protein